MSMEYACIYILWVYFHYTLYIYRYRRNDSQFWSEIMENRVTYTCNSEQKQQHLRNYSPSMYFTHYNI